MRKELSAGNYSALDNFWQEVASRGAPLVEPVMDNVFINRPLPLTIDEPASEAFKRNVKYVISLLGQNNKPRADDN